MHTFVRRWFVPLVAVAAMGVLSACSPNKSAFIRPYEAGQAVSAARSVDSIAGSVKGAWSNDPSDQFRKSGVKIDRRDWVTYRHEQGAILRAAGEFEESSVALHHADLLMQMFEQEPEVKISREVGAALTNLTMLDYKGYAYDRIAVQVYQSLNHMQLGKLDEARVSLRAMMDYQAQAAEHFQKKIDKIEGKKEGDGKPTSDSVDMDKTRADPRLASSLKAAYGHDVQVVPDRTAYRAFTNPFGEYLTGVYFLAAGQGAGDLETAATAFRNVKGTLPSNGFLANDLALAESVASGKPLPPTTFVLFETGLAPRREQITIHIPVFIFNIAVHDTRVDYVGAAFPKLRFVGGNAPYATVVAGGTNHQTALLTDMDEVIKTDFDNELPLVITRTIAAAATKAAVAYGINTAAKNDAYARLAAGVLTTAYQIAVNQADLRTWESLPKQFQAASFPTPADRTVTISLPGGGTLPPVKLIDGVVNVIHVKSIQAGQPPIVTQFKLK